MYQARYAPLAAIAALAFAANANAQTVLNYWDFTTTTDVVGGVTSTSVGTPDLSIDATYLEAYPGSGNSLNIDFNVQSYLIAEVHDGVNPTALDFGTNDFAFSYWSYDDTSDGNTRGPRIFDMLAGTTTGVQLGTNATNIYNLRVDSDAGGSWLSNNTLTTLQPLADQWMHVVVNFDRTANQYEIFFNGASQGTVPMTDGGAIFATKDMDIGVINSEGSGNQSENCGLDDLAFYDAQLSAGDIAGLAAGTLTPLNFTGVTADFCNGDGGDQMGCTDCPCGNNAAPGTIGGCLNSAISSCRLLASGSSSIGAADLRIEASGAPPSVSAVLTSGDAQAPANAMNPCFGLATGIQSVNLDGLRCAVQNVLRHGVRPSDANGDIGVTTNGWGDPNGFFNFGAFASGQTKHFQIIYRDDDLLVCQTGQNTSQGRSVTFQP